MIHLNIEGKSWPEVTEQLANLAREHQVLGDEREALGRLQGDLAEAKTANKLLRQIIEDKDARIAELEQQLAELAAEAEPAENPTPAAEPAPEMSDTAAPTETDTAEDDATVPATSEQPTYKKEAVREFLAECRNKGVNITDVLKPFGGRFPAVAEADYPALMEAAKKALAEKGAK